MSIKLPPQGLHLQPPRSKRGALLLELGGTGCRTRFNDSGRIRTCTTLSLSQGPLPVGLRSRELSILESAHPDSNRDSQDHDLEGCPYPMPLSDCHPKTLVGVDASSRCEAHPHCAASRAAASAVGLQGHDACARCMRAVIANDPDGACTHNLRRDKPVLCWLSYEAFRVFTETADSLRARR
jgi:hypothetical protein